MSEKLMYEELTPKEFLERLAKAPIAYLPLGTLEWHGEHLPLGSDGIQSQGFLVELARRVGGIVLPMLFLGPEQYRIIGGKEYFHMDLSPTLRPDPRQLPGSMHHIYHNLFAQYLRNILRQLRRAGFRIVVAHGHGPSTGMIRANLDKWGKEFDLKLFHCWREDESDGLGIQTDHAGANETSLVMALRPDLVQVENLCPEPDVWPAAVHGKDPRVYASPELGKKAIETQAERMVGLLEEALGLVGL
ncbi:MAG: creatininase family protein [Armatimonadota bacterium]|nr:creatininase family protein [Armatimonadota bacterium]